MGGAARPQLSSGRVRNRIQNDLVVARLMSPKATSLSYEEMPEPIQRSTGGRVAKNE